MIFYDDYVLKHYYLLLINHVNCDMLFTLNTIPLTNFLSEGIYYYGET